MTTSITPVPGKSYFLDSKGRKVGLVLESDDWAEEYFRPPPPPPRKPADAQAVWVSEAELPNFIPYSLREIREMRKRGDIKPYPDLRPGGRRVMYNLLEVSARIRAGRQVNPTSLLAFNPEEIQVTI